MSINWLEWSKEAFELARRESKPVILDIYGSWCAWCHQMERTYSDSDVARIIKDNFVAVRVDTDKRPDINERYNQGGWPSTVFLTDEGKVITGATYLKPGDMKPLLAQVLGLYKSSDFKVEGDVLSIRPKPPKKAGITDSITADVISLLLNNFDAEHGGVGYEPKFPVPDLTELALLKCKKNKELLSFATKTLDRMAGSMDRPVTGIFDNEEGGFFRYSVSRDWSLPHYEKMAETNALLLLNYLHAYQVTGNQRYRTVAEKTIGYIKNNLSNQDGGFYSSQDADGEDEYYGLPGEERKNMERPAIDRTVYINYSSMLVSAFLEAYAVLGDESCRDFALKTADFLIQNCYDKEKGMAHYHGGNVYGLAADNIRVLNAILACSNYDKKYLGYAEAVAKFLLENLKEKGGAFFDRIKQDDDIGLLKARNKSIDGNSAAAECFLKLAVFTGNDSYKKAAEEVLDDFSAEYRRYGMHAAGYALAIEKFIDPIEIVVAGLKKELPPLLSHFEPRKIVVFIDPESEEAAKKGYTAEGIFVCRRMTCNRFGTADEAVRYMEKQ